MSGAVGRHARSEATPKMCGGLKAGDCIAIIGIAVIALLFAVVLNGLELLALITQLQGGAP